VRLFLKLLLALAIGAICVVLVLRDIDLTATWTALSQVSMPAVAVYLVMLALTHLLRSWRWAHLLRPIGVTLPGVQLLAISSVGFLAIQALPVRLGEFVRPYLVVRGGQSRMSAVLGTVAVERVVDGLLISIIFFVCYVTSERAWPPQLEAAAWLSLLLFLAALIFLAAALRWPETTIHLGLWLLLLPRLAPRLSVKLRDKLRALIQGFRVLREPGSLVPFLVQSVLYWATNGLGMWLLAQGMRLDVSPMAAYAAMSFTGVLISLPNSPGLVGQFHLGVVAALAAYLPEGVAARSSALAYATLLHGIQLIWYILLGLACLPFVPGNHSLREAVVESNRAAGELESPRADGGGR
jgi:uncharacterized protein (TIRG00374 family)